jgi:hypothetical protein
VTAAFRRGIRIAAAAASLGLASCSAGDFPDQPGARGISRGRRQAGRAEQSG